MIWLITPFFAIDMKQRVPEILLEIVKIDLWVFLALNLYYLSVILSGIKF